jgi:hypothetical protein
VAVTRETLLKIAAVANDEATDEATRAVAMLRLQEIHKRHPELFKHEDEAPPTAPAGFKEDEDAFDDVGGEDKLRAEALERAREAFLDRLRWHVSSRGNPVRVAHGFRITVFPSKYDGGFSWSAAREDSEDAPIYSRGSFPTKDAAKANAWAEAILPRLK